MQTMSKVKIPLNVQVQLQALYTLSLDIYFQRLKVNIFITSKLVGTQPHLNVITGWRRDILQEPWWRVPGTAGVELTTSSTIPERISSNKDVLDKILTACVTELVMSNEARHCRTWRVAGVSTGTYTSCDRVIFALRCSKCPNMPARISSINIIRIFATNKL